MENEKIIWQGNSSLISNFGSFMVGIILTLTVVGAIVGIPYIIWTYLVIKNKKEIMELYNQWKNKYDEESRNSVINFLNS